LNDSPQYRLVIADDHPLFRGALREAVSGLMYLRAQYPSVPVVVVSANDDPSVVRRCMDFGASGFIPKTLGIEDMRRAVMRVLKGEV
jgi:DNA-binding NarL/FixJ family response regulator